MRDYVIAHSGESGIVYCSTRKTVDALAGELAEALAPAAFALAATMPAWATTPPSKPACLY